MESFQGYTTLVTENGLPSWAESGSGYYVVSRSLVSESAQETRRWNESGASLQQPWSSAIESGNSPTSQKVGESRRDQSGSSRGRHGSEQTKAKRKRRRVISTEQRRAANIRERKRMFQLNEAFAILRKRVPTFAYEKKLSRIETLRLAVNYITFMSELVNGDKSATDLDDGDAKTAKPMKEFILKDVSEDEEEEDAKHQ